MTYTIRDNEGNMICSIENIDPTKSEEGAGTVVGVTAAVLATIGLIKRASKKHKDKKLLKIINSFDNDKLEKIKKYINYLDENLYTMVEKVIEKNKNIIGIYEIPVLGNYGLSNDINADIKKVNKLSEITFYSDVSGVFRCKKITENNLKTFDKNVENDLINKYIPETKAKIIEVECYDDHDDDDEMDEDTITRSVLCKIKHDPEILDLIKELIEYVSTKTKF